MEKDAARQKALLTEATQLQEKAVGVEEEAGVGGRTKLSRLAT